MNTRSSSAGRRAARILCLAAIPPLLFAASLGAQCLPQDDTLENLYLYLIDVVTEESGFFADRREWLGVARGDSSAVVKVFDDEICGRASEAYRREFALPGPAPDVHVIRFGERYVVMDPETRGGEFNLYLVLDLEFRKTGGWAG